MSSSNVATRRRRRPVLRSKENSSTEDSLLSYSPDIMKEKKNKPSDIKGFLSVFQSAAKGVPEAKFWKERGNLAQCVVESSLYMPELPTGSLLLEESSIDLLNHCRQLTKEATSAKELNVVFDCLTVSIHGLRALGATLEGSQKDSAIKLLYHCITTAETKITSKTYEATASFYCLAACEALAVYLRGYSLGDDFTIQKSQKSFFPVPVRRAGEASKAISAEQITTIVLQSISSVVKVLLSTVWEGDVKTSGLRMLRKQLRVSVDWPSDHSSCQFGANMVRECAMPWISFLASTTKSSKEVSSHCRRLHRILWKGAESATSSQTALFLRGEAVAAFLASPFKNTDKTIMTVQRAHFDQACNYSWTAALAYLRKETATDKNLLSFHQKVGTILESAAGVTNSAMYLEYCAYRSLHCGPSDECMECDDSSCFFHGQRFHAVHGQCGKLDLDHAGLALFHLCLETRQQLTMVEGIPEDVTVERWEKLLCTFPELIKEERSKTTLLRWFKLLSKLSLHRAVFDFLQRSDHARPGALLIAARVLSECLGPLVLCLIKACVLEDDKLGPAWDIVSECYRVGFLAFETLSLKEEGSDVLSKLSSILSLNIAPVSSIEKGAKFMANTGRRMWDDYKDPESVKPLLRSLHLFELLSQRSDGSNLRDAQLSLRWGYLSSIYSTLEQWEEAILAGSTALLFDIMESAISTGVEARRLQMELLLFLGLSCSDFVSFGPSSSPLFSQRRQNIVSRLIRIQSQHSELVAHEALSRSPTSALVPSMIVKSLLQANEGDPVAALVEKRCGLVFSLGSLLRCLFTQHSLSRHDSVDRPAFEVEATSAYILIMERLGQRISECSSAQSLDDFKLISKLGLASVQRAFASKESNSSFLLMAKSMIHMTGSVSLLRQSVVSDLDSLPGIADVIHLSNPALSLCVEFAQNALVLVSKAGGECILDDWSLLRLSVCIAIRLFCLQIASMVRIDFQDASMRRVFEEIRFASRRLDESTSCSSLVSISRHCLVKSTTRISDVLSLEGHGIEAARTTIWCKELAFGPPNKVAETWIQSTTSLRSISDTVTCIRSDTPQNVQDCTTVGGDIDPDSAFLRVALRHSTDPRTVNAIAQQFLRLIAQIDSQTAIRGVDIQWLKSTSLLGLAECAEKRGDLENSVFYLKKCFTACKAVASGSRRCALLPHKNNSLDSWWQGAALASLPLRAIVRQIYCLKLLAIVQSRLGDHRKALGYAESLLNDFGDRSAGRIRGKSSLEETLSAFQSAPSSTHRDRQLRRLFLSLKTKSMPLNQVYERAGAHENCSAFLPVQYAGWYREEEGTVDIEDIFDMWLLWDMVGAEHRFLTFHDAKNRCSSVELAIHKLLKTRGVTELVSSLREENKKETQENNVPAIILHAKLQELVLCLSDPSGVPRIADADIEFLRSAAESHFLENGSRAKALNVLGRMSLQKAVEYRQLESAWDSEDSDELFFVEEAKEYFVAALRLLGDSFDLLTRNILRSFALVSAKQIPSWLSCSLITSSIGRFTSRHIEKLLSGETCSCQGESPLDGSQASHLLQLVNGVGDARSKAEISFEQFHHLANHMPSAWRFVSLALCESGELLVSSISAEDEAQDSLYFQTECISPRQDTNAESATIYDHLMVPLDRIIQQSQSNLNARSSTGSKPSSDSAEDTKRKWWAARKKMDSDLEELLSEVERKYFSSSEIKTLIFGHDGLDSMLSCGNLAAKFAAVSEPTDDMDPSELKVAELRDELMEYGMTSASVRKMRKKELVELVGQERKRRLGRKDEKPKDDRQSRGNKSDSYIFLILDENLQRFPFESMPCFDGKTVCRLPSLAFGVAALSPSNDMNTTDPTRVSYVIDPESNLSATQERLLPVVDSLSKKYGNNAWAGVVGQPPTIDFMEDQLRQPGGLLLYFGHGGGQQWLSRTTLQGMISPLGRQAKSSVVLMGCSSGRLESVNRKDCRYEKELPIHYEPEGIALSYLSAGAPCVVGNLWDVTDRDIDRYAQTVLERFFEGNLSLAQCVAEARSACKLRYMVGSAPVCYGMPVFCKKAK